MESVFVRSWILWIGVSISMCGCPSGPRENQPAAASTAPAVGAAPLSPEVKAEIDAIVWETNENDPVFSSDQAKRGGTLYTFMLSYPQTFRLYGPNSNDQFANFTRQSCLAFGLVDRHPNTRNPIPMLATHWKVMPDQKTLYFKLDPDARFSDGVPITADDYVFTDTMMRSKAIADPFYNQYFEDRIESVTALDRHILKIVTKRPSWKALFEYALTPIPRHATTLDQEWVKRTNWEKPICPGPYRIDEVQVGKRVTFKRIENWWGNEKRYFKGRFNFDRWDIRVVREDRLALDLFKKKELTWIPVSSAAVWAKETDFDAVKRNWVIKRQVFTEKPSGLYGMIFNLNKPLLKNKPFRKALQHLFNFEKLNTNLMFGSYMRLVSTFQGTEYANPTLVAYEPSVEKARGYLKEAGFEKRGPDGIRVNGRGERATFTLQYSAGSVERHISVIAEDFRNEGIDVKLKTLDGATAFRNLLQKSYEAGIVSMSAQLEPEPWQYFHSSFKDTPNNNNFFGFGSPKTDALIDVYRWELDREKRKTAMAELDAIIQDEAFYIPFWYGPFVRYLAWNEIGTPDPIEPRLSSSINDFDTYWFDPEKAKQLNEAMKGGTALPSPGPVDNDPYGIRVAGAK